MYLVHRQTTSLCTERLPRARGKNVLTHWDNVDAPQPSMTESSNKLLVIDSHATLGRPTQIGCFSVSNKTVTANSISSLQYFKQPHTSALLNEGRSTYVRRYRNDLSLFHPRPLDNILSALNPNNKDLFRDADVVTWRGIIYKLVAFFITLPRSEVYLGSCSVVR